MGKSSPPPTPKCERLPGRFRSYRLFPWEVLEASDRAFPGLVSTFPTELRENPTTKGIKEHLCGELRARYEKAIETTDEAPIDWDAVYGTNGVCTTYQNRKSRKLPLHNALMGFVRSMDRTCGDCDE